MNFRRKISYTLLLILIPLLSLVMHFHVFHLNLIGYHVWRQTQTQTVINNFYKEDMNIFHPRYNEKPDTSRIVRMEFPLMQWIFAWFYKWLGNYIAISRVLTFIIGLFSVWGIFKLLDALFNNKMLAAIGAWTFNWSPVFYYYTVNPLPDNLALCCAIWCLVFFFRYHQNSAIKNIFFSAFFLSVATLVKLPFFLYGTAPLIYLLILLFQKKEVERSLLIGFIFCIFLLPAAAWYAWVIPTWDQNGIVKGVINNTTGFMDLLDILQHNVVSTLPELLINYGSVIFFIAGFYFIAKKKWKGNIQFRLLAFSGCAVVAYFLFEMNMIAKVHDYYLFPFLPFIFIVVALGAGQLLNSRYNSFKYLALIAIGILPLTAFLRADTRWNIQEPGFNAVYYQYQSVFEKMIPKNAICVAGNDDSHFILLYYINRKGWTFDHDNLTVEQLSFYRSRGAKYLFSDSRKVEDENIGQLQQKIFEQGTLKVYELK